MSQPHPSDGFGIFEKKWINQISFKRVEGLKLALKIQKDLKHGEPEEAEVGVLELKAWSNRKGQRQG